MDNMYLSGEYVEKNPTFHVEDSPWKAKQIQKMVGRHNLRPKSICEIGCGAGEILRELQPNFPNGTSLSGFEISPQAFELCRHKENDELHFFCQDLIATEIAPFDLLLCMDVFEHVEDYMGFLRNLRQKADYKVFHIPLDMSVQTVLRSTPIVEARSRVGHLHYFSKETALLTLRDTGYTVVDWFYTPAGTERGTTLGAKIAKLPRQILSVVNEDLAVRVLGGYSLLVLAR